MTGEHLKSVSRSRSANHKSVCLNTDQTCSFHRWDSLHCWSVHPSVHPVWMVGAVCTGKAKLSEAVRFKALFCSFLSSCSPTPYSPMILLPMFAGWDRWPSPPPPWASSLLSQPHLPPRPLAVGGPAQGLLGPAESWSSLGLKGMLPP